MTAPAPLASQNRPPASHPAAVPWRRLMRVTVRQHRTALLWTGVVLIVAAIALVATGVPLHELAASGGPNWYGQTRSSVDYGGVLQWFAVVFQLVIVMAGMFLGAPLLPRELDSGTAKLAWTQAAGRTRWLLAQVLPIASLLALAALGLGAEWSWWLSPFPPFDVGRTTVWSPWWPLGFNLNPLLLAGWVVFAFTLGVFLGAAIRRTLPAVAATLVCSGALLFEVADSWRMHYIPPLHRAVAVQFQADGYSYGVPWGSHQSVIMSQSLGWPDGRPLINLEQLYPATWMRLHHIVMWFTYQPASRLHTFQLIELGWLLAACALLVAAAIFLVSRRPA